MYIYIFTTEITDNDTVDSFRILKIVICEYKHFSCFCNSIRGPCLAAAICTNSFIYYISPCLQCSPATSQKENYIL